MTTAHLSTFDLSGRIALVTGATKGMGRAIAAILAQAGARVIVSSRSQAECEKVAVGISTPQAPAIGIASDIAEIESLRSLVTKTRDQAGSPDILVGNAAVAPYFGPLGKVEPEIFDQTMIANVRNNLFLINLLTPDMIARGYGSIILTSSISARTGQSVLGPYGASKAALEQLVRNLAVELGPHQVRVNAIAPGPVKTEFSRVLWENPDALKRNLARIPQGRLGEAEDVAGLALLLASPAGAFINGQSIGVDGGASAV